MVKKLKKKGVVLVFMSKVYVYGKFYACSQSVPFSLPGRLPSLSPLLGPYENLASTTFSAAVPLLSLSCALLSLSRALPNDLKSHHLAWASPMPFISTRLRRLPFYL